MNLSEAERSFYFQQAKYTYLKYSDKCTKFFHSIVKRNTKRNFIAAVLKRDGSYTSSQKEVADEFIHVFADLLEKDSICQPFRAGILDFRATFPSEHSTSLIRNVSRLEIKDALFSIGDEKSPGPDGYSSCFFKESWDIVGDDFSDVILEFFASGSLLKQMNHTVIALIPKANHASLVGDYRPIACCNVIYKVISNILALGSTLGSIIDHAWVAFVKGRSMVENIQLAQELLRQYNRKRVTPRCLLKIDLKKAYDSVSWDFLKNMLGGLNFPTKFMDWIMECLSTPAYFISLNGGLHGLFKGRKGLRQGDPLYPFLFVLCLEYFSRMVKGATENNEFNFHPKCALLKITHLAFADDLMLFAKGDTTVSILMDCLTNFGNMLGLRMNIDESNLYIVGVHAEDMEMIHGIVKIPKGSMPFRYLGIPLATERLKISTYDTFLDKITAHIGAWSRVSLSYAGKLELVKAVIQGVECFWLSIFPIPSTVASKIISLCQNFLWGSKKPLVTWRNICLSKGEGVLGLRDIKAWISKTLWNIHCKKDTLWIKWVNQV
ncbi:Hypothetical predicted protein [Olea europaea subsp. europaea]|uniref:Reverse transcriptase domain-containing protein n=1 Tax=Olea europaea subsp. europaea TaxID=158383 RepID=A0A8S0UMU3_OLEEU|nr:Hypothetical predicted protein [Olea europaea subsp. europaea]